MHPSFGVPWPRLQRAAARLSELHAQQPEPARVHALLFICGLKYLMTYRAANGRRLSHYIDDGLREAVEFTIPPLIDRCREYRSPHPQGTRLPARESNDEFRQLIFGFGRLHADLPPATARWIARGNPEFNLVRLTFGMGVTARFAPNSHGFVRRMLHKPLIVSIPVIDVWESFHWNPEWSVALAR
jgi:hypothetical protein